jgi:hypothetical protein
VSDYLAFLFSDVPTQDLHTGAAGLAANPKARRELWLYIRDHFDDILTRLSKNMVVLNRLLRESLKKFADRETEKDIAKLFENRDNRGYDRTLNIVRDTVLGRAAYKERDAAVIREWLKTNGYA